MSNQKAIGDLLMRLSTNTSESLTHDPLLSGATHGEVLTLIKEVCGRISDVRLEVGRLTLDIADLTMAEMVSAFEQRGVKLTANQLSALETYDDPPF